MGNADRMLARAVEIAAQVHADQKDKAGEPYILHPMRLAVRARGFGVETQMVAMLHDVVEDDERPAGERWTVERMRAEGFPETVAAAVEHMTRREGESYEAFVERIAAAEGRAGEVARRVKLLDLEDNMDVVRLADVSDEDAKRLRRYRAAHRRLTEGRAQG